MSEMVERVARAINAAVSPLAPSDMMNIGGFPQWKVHELAARAAIEAMREPTTAMIDKAVRDEGIEPAWAKIYWQCMIDEVLK